MTQGDEGLKPADHSSVWLIHCWRDWDRQSYCSTDTDKGTAERPYLHWHLAVELTSPEANDIRRGAAIQKLWNAVESRVRMLHTEYQMAGLKSFLGWPRKTDMLEMLERLGLARPLILRQLKEIRNSVEHQDQGAPSHEDCLRFIDSVWYFLRSTDIFASRRILSFDRSLALPTSTNPNRTQFIEFDFEGPTWAPEIRGRFPRSAIHMSPHQDAIELILEEPPVQSDRDSVYLHGAVATASPGVEEIVRDYFLIDLPENVPSTRYSR